MTLSELLNGARIVNVDNAMGLTLVWKGGCGVHAYNDAGREVWFWNVCGGEKKDADAAQVIESMEDRIVAGDYACPSEVSVS
jgi:hypothetical protein